MLRQHQLIFDLTFLGVKKSPCLRLMEWKGEREREIIGKTKIDQMRQFRRDGEQVGCIYCVIETNVS